MRKVFVFIFVSFFLGACDLWEEYKIDFVDIESENVVKFELTIEDSTEIVSYKKYLNEVLVESTFFSKDTNKVERITYNSSDKIILKRLYKFGVDTFAFETLDSLFLNDSIIIRTSEYSYNMQFLSRVHEYYYGANIEFQHDLVYNFKYGNQNKIERAVNENNNNCIDIIEYTDIPNNIELNNFVESGHFSNQLLGTKNTNLLSVIYWKSSCFTKENQAKPESKFTYELDDNGYVIMLREQYTPEYNTALDNNIERFISTTYYEYIFK